MATRELAIGVIIGATVNGAFRSAFAGAKTVVGSLGREVEALTRKQNDLGASMQRGMRFLSDGSLATLNREYARIGRTIDEVRAKQERLAASIARGQQLGEQRRELGASWVGLGAQSVAFAAPVWKSLGISGAFQEQLRDIRITGQMTAAEEQHVGGLIRQSARRWIQTQEEVARGTGVLVANNIQNVKDLEFYIPLLGKAATATSAGMDDLGRVIVASKNSLKIEAKDMEATLNILAFAGKAGSFEIRDMANWLPKLAPAIANVGMTGKKAVAELGASLQVAMMGAGSADEAANNFMNFLNKIFSPDALKDFDKAGIDLKGQVNKLVATGMSPIQAMLEIIDKYLKAKGPGATAGLRKAMSIEDAAQREQALQSIGQSFKLGSLFQDMQVLAFLRPALANRSRIGDIQRGALGAADSDMLGKDWKSRAELSKQEWKRFKIGMADIGITIGNALLPAFNDLVRSVQPAIAKFGEWAEKNPGLVRGLVTLGGGLLAAKGAVLALRTVWTFGILSPLNAANTLFTSISGKITLFRLALASSGSGTTAFFRVLGFGEGAAARLGASIGRIGAFLRGPLLAGLRQAIPWIGRLFLGSNPVGWIIGAVITVAAVVYKYWQPIKAFMIGVWQGASTALRPVFAEFAATGRVLADAAAPLKPLWTAIGGALAAAWRWVSELFTPVKSSAAELRGATQAGQRFGQVLGAAIGYVLAPIRLFVRGIGWVVEATGGMRSAAVAMVGEVQQAFAGGLGGVARLFLRWSPLGLFARAFQPVLGWLGALWQRFAEFGRRLVDGLVSGITQKAGALKDSITRLGNSVTGWFTQRLGIRSPSRVFMGYGANIAEGAALGIRERSAQAASAADALAKRVAAAAAKARAMAAPASAAGGWQLTYSPQIHVPAGTPAQMRGDLDGALRMSFEQFERWFQRVERDRTRRGF
ncbi:phage tail tape measure protein [Lysobacter sp. CA196]|uniref:phage tail tape measure protein n=1 Tax=Lysobacter sp. CA196 TaxID=3455606 RepID=UPI003F8D5D39